MTMQTKDRLGLVSADSPVIMVDDDELDIEAATRGLRRTNISNPFLAFGDGPPFLRYVDAVYRGDAGMPAVVLLDINMPLMTGFEVLKKLRNYEAFAENPHVFMLTSSTHEKDRKRALAAGANDYLVKPQDYRQYSAFFELLFDG
ncbi:MAG: response regulator [Woeseia sp.]